MRKLLPLAASSLLFFSACNSADRQVDLAELPDLAGTADAGPPTVNLNQGENQFTGPWFAKVNDGGLDPVPDGALTPMPAGYDLPDGGAGPNVARPYGVFQNALNLWTKLGPPPYYGSASTMLRRVLDVTPRASGTVTVVAKFRWRFVLSDVVHPQMTFGIVTKNGDDMFLQIFGAGNVLHTRFGLKMTDALQIGTWYRVVLTIAGGHGANGRSMRVQIFDDKNAETWHNCEDTAADPCPGAPADLSSFEAFHISIAIDDTRAGEANIQLQDVFVQQDPPAP